MALSLFWKNTYLIGLLAIQTTLCLHMPRKKRFLLIWVIFTVLLAILSSAVMQTWKWDGNTIAISNIISNEVWRLLVALLIVIQTISCYEIAWQSALYLIMFSLFFQQISFSFYKIAEYYLFGVIQGMPELPSVFLELFCLIVFCLIGYLVIGRKGRNSIVLNTNNAVVILLSIAALFINNICSTYLYAHDDNINIGNTMVAMRIYSICFNVITIYLIHDLLVNQVLRTEQATMEEISRQRRRQYEISQELMEAVSIKNHDLKKQLGYLKQSKTGADDFVQELNEVTNRFDAVVHTQNGALSTILNEKSMQCSRYAIPITITANGNGMDFMRDIDIYTLFANLLDNSIEASLQLEEGKRGISLHVHCQQGMLTIRCENYFQGKISYQNQIPTTTKTDRLQHGFGTKSIRNIVESYDGSLLFDTHDQIFVVSILIPIP